MGLKKFLKFSYILLLAITLTACTGSSSKKTPSGNNDGSNNGNDNIEEIEETICTTHPSSDYCKIITANTRLERKDVKPIQHKAMTSKNELLYWSDPLYNKGFQYTNKEYATANFSLDTGSTLIPRTSMYYIFYSNDGKLFAKGEYQEKILLQLGGSINTPMTKGIVGDKLVRLALFPDKTYLVLPPIEIIA